MVFNLEFDEDTSAYNTPDENNTAQVESNMKATPLEIFNVIDSFVNSGICNNVDTSTNNTINLN